MFVHPGMAIENAIMIIIIAGNRAKDGLFCITTKQVAQVTSAKVLNSDQQILIISQT